MSVKKFYPTAQEAIASFGEPSRLSPSVQRLGYTGLPITQDELSKLRETIASMSPDGGSKRVNYPPVIVCCAQCKMFGIRQAADVMKHERRGLGDIFCSTQCWGVANNERRFGKRKCVQCGGPAPKATSCGMSTKPFCSEACKEQSRAEEYEARNLAKLRPCQRCNALFIPTVSTQMFCGRDCADRAHSAKMLGETNPRWKGGVFKQRTKPHVARRYREMRPLVLKRDGEKCLLCEGTDRLNVHHIDENPLNNRTTNLATLCWDCHMKVHFSEQKEALSSKLKTLAEMPLSTTYRWKKPNASSRTAS